MRVTMENLWEHIYTLQTQATHEGLGIIRRGDALSIDIGGDSVEIKQSMSLLHDSTGAMVWKSSVEFAKYALNNQFLVADKNVIELGCGTGFLAKVLGPISRHWVATDQKPLLKLAATNTANVENVKVVEFDWEQHDFDPPYIEDCLVVACDTIYNDYLVSHFITAVKSVLGAVNNGTCLLVVHIREPEMLIEGFEKLVAEFHVDFIHHMQDVGVYALYLHEEGVSLGV